MERRRKGRDGEDGTGAQRKRKRRDRWGVDSARRKQVRQGPRS